MKVNNKFCNVNMFTYDEETKDLKVIYKIVGEITYKDFTKSEYDLLCQKNKDNKTLGITLKKILKNKNIH